MTTLDQAKVDLIDLLIRHQVLKFGEFKLKSGRLSPYFFNLGALDTGSALAQLGGAYARLIKQSGLSAQLLFGPAYKGIPIATAAAVALAGQGVDLGVAYNRKEKKDHGEGGQLVGADVAGRSVVLVDDVLTAGTAMREAVGLVEEAQGKIAGVVIALDRQEIVTSSGDNKQAVGTTAVQALAAELGDVPVLSILSLQDVMGYLEQPVTSAGLGSNTRTVMAEYQAQYCLL